MTNHKNKEDRRRYCPCAIDRFCVSCGAPFVATHSRTVTCSKVCGRRNQNRHKQIRDKQNGRAAAKSHRRDREIRQATPKWADRKAIEALYLSRGESEEVDHVIPRNGKKVSGLHVETNLRVVSKDLNRNKAAAYRPKWEIFRPDLLR